VSLRAIFGREIERGQRRHFPSLFPALAFRLREVSALDWGLQALAHSPSRRRRRQELNRGAEGQNGASQGRDEASRERGVRGNGFRSREHGESAHAGAHQSG